MEKRDLSLSNTLLAFGVLLLILGAGNAIFGHLRATYYKNLLQTVQEADGLVRTVPGRETATEGDEGEDEPLAEDELQYGVPETLRSEWSSHGPTAEDRAQIERLESRYAFYRFCILGGKALLALSAVLLLSGLLLRHGRAEISPDNLSA